MQSSISAGTAQTNADDLRFMTLALEWAGRDMYTTTPNPRVGCVIVRNGEVIAAGHTQPPGQPHAEAQALLDAARRGIDVRGATAYVTLEPCSHFGRTPPCADALVNAGVARVVAAIEDPNPLVAGQGVARLRAAGVACEVGLLRDEAYEINIGFFSRMQRKRPWVRMKVAASLDGKTALHNGQSQWITGAQARDDGHAWRARACAILTGIGTIQADDAQLSVRAVETKRQPRRIIVDSKLAIDPQARVLDGGGAWIFSATDDADKRARLRERGAEVIVLANEQGKVDLPGMMIELGRREINELHVEAGAKLNGSLLREGCTDELLLYFAPILLGDARGMFELEALQDMRYKRQLRFHDICRIGDDVRMLARLV